MFSKLVAAVIAVVVGAANAQLDPAGAGLNITQPSSEIWWVAGAVNTLAWTCHATTLPLYTLVFINSNPDILTAPDAFLANLKNADCSETITPTSFNPGTGYQVALANPSNESDFYAISEMFELKAPGSAYPTVTTTDIGGATSTGSGGSGTGSAAGSTPTSAAPRTKVAFGLIGLVAAGLAFSA